EVFNAFTPAVRRGAQRSLDGLGAGFAGRGRSLNLALEALPPLLRDLEPVAANLADSRTGLARFVRALGAFMRELAPVAETQAALFANLDTTFSALASVARPYLQEAITRSVATQDTALAELPRQRPFLRNATALSRELRPGLRALPPTARALADA